MTEWEVERIAKVVENYMEHSKFRSKDPGVMEIARKAVDIDIWEMWCLTQGRDDCREKKGSFAAREKE